MVKLAVKVTKMNGNSGVINKENKYLMNDTIFEMEQNVEFAKKTANIILEENRNYKNGIEKWDSSNYWIEQRINKNIFNLKAIIKDANLYLKRSNMEVLNNAYTKSLNFKFDMSYNEILKSKDENVLKEWDEYSKQFIQTMPMSFFLINIDFKLVCSTVKYSIDLDLNVGPHLNMKHLYDLCLNLKEPTMLVDFIPDMRRIVKEKMLSSIIQVPSFQTKKSVFDSLIRLSEEKNYVCSNILIMPLIESLTKNFLKAVYEGQNPKQSEEQIEKSIYHKYNSLNELISKIELRSDYPITYGELQGEFLGSTNSLIINETDNYNKNLKLQHNSRGYLQKIVNIGNDENLTDEEKLHRMEILSEEILNHGIKEEDLIKDIKKPIYIPINIRLEFLQRKMYQDRNQILHGLFDKIEPWKHYLYLNGLCKLLEVIEDYYAKRKVS